MAEGRLSCQRAGETRRPAARMGHSGHRVDSVTSLMWLRDFSLKDIGITGPIDGPSIPSFAAPCSPLAAEPLCLPTSQALCKPISSSTPRAAQHAMATHPQLTDDVDYKTNPHVKPPYSYATLICMAMEASAKPITLSDIYQWISNNFCYFRHADPTWQNSIRRNLSLQKRFIRVPREKGDPGKGGFWKLDPQYSDQLKNGGSRKRRMTPVQLQPASTERAHAEAQCVASPAAPAPASAKVPRLSNSSLPSQGEQPELGWLEEDLGLEAIFDTSLTGELSLFEDLELTPPNKATRVNLDSTADGQHGDRAQGQEQVLTESSENDLDFGETWLTTSLLHHPWSEETEDDLYNCVNIEQLFEPHDASLPADGSDWSSLASPI
ncbi:forkhead box protein J1-B-like [Athene cunicularia]|uniref:forkhead box protein J1-B-like n=1 Tax=Athene cunicularia TaxID=194338 RepID=UPI000EF729D2|nr:forkhead box protein J1-B-like [Athene cunicularia]